MFQTPQNSGMVNALRTFEALFGKVSNGLGPTNARWNTFTGEMTPEGITSALEQANAGIPFQILDMYRRAVEQDATLGGAVEQRFAGVISKQDRIEPPLSLTRDKVAIGLANWLRAVREQVSDFDRVRYSLMWADGAGYAGAEIIYGYRDLVWFDGDGKKITKTYCVPVKLETVDGRGFRFDTETDEPLLWLSGLNGGGYASIPQGKFIFHRAFGVQATIARRGFMRSCIWLHAMKQWCLRDLAEFLHLYGLPQMVASYDRDRFAYDEARRIYNEVRQSFGQGGFPLVPMNGFDLRTDTPPVQGALVHSQATDFLNGEIIKRITLGPLTMESSGGSYGLGDIHAEGAFDGKLLSANNLCSTIREQLWTPAIALNLAQLTQDLGVLPKVVTMAMPDYHCRLLREDTPEQRQKIFSQAAKDGIELSKRQYRAELHLDEPADENDAVHGEGVAVASGGKVVGATQASDGAEAPKDPAENVAQIDSKRRAGVIKHNTVISERRSGEWQTMERCDPGVLVALYPPQDLAQRLALPGGEPAGELHITLAYLGRASKLTRPVGCVTGAMAAVAKRYVLAPLEGAIGGVGRFAASGTSDNKDPFYASVDVPGLVELRQAIVSTLAHYGFAISTEHGFTPHITLAYLDSNTPSPLDRLEAVPVRFDEFYLVIGAMRIAFPLVGAAEASTGAEAPKETKPEGESPSMET